MSSQADSVVRSSPDASSDTKPEVAIVIDDTSVTEQKKDSASIWRRCLSFIWDSVDGDPEYRRYVRRLDLFFFPTVLFGYFIKYLDQTNYSNAFVSGMQEDLSLYDNERNWLNTWFALGVIIGSVPAQLLQLRYIRPSILIPSCELAWSALVIAMGFAKTIKTMYALRFFIGLLESCAFPGYTALLGAWYGPTELAKRIAILLEVESIAGMFSGYLQAGLYSSMNGRHGLAGWRWLFVMDGVISLPIALWGFFGLPDTPHNTRAFYLNKEHVRYGIQRIERLGHVAQERLTWAKAKAVYCRRDIWLFVFPYVMLAANHSATQYFNLYLKASGYSVSQRNTLPTAGNALAIVITILWGMLADRTHHYYWLIVSLCGVMMLSNILLSVWNIPHKALMAAYYISYAGSATTPVLIAWANLAHASDPHLRSLLVATSNVFSYAWVLWVPLVLFPTYNAPKYKYGYQILILFGGLAVVGVTLLRNSFRRKSG
ncbi:unnamed protein product [Zymoseptoria tritici ST99CH_3D1]|uniref:Major facilitator superfamily (MFS) profile domain-containing protein n=2 Tax=Zymoseptoria tritici TaxID=1047171 RepID=A0A1X7RLS1_ZYMT9|nr:unnamed protein product [Zymoseptoria tritici ST99CH_3D7]SMR48158.1 unnamed protein product [Zymoseptoria tritici ST99CH_1E4]SMR49368.1 unnamed protein product [Zymoseptoria tritici ST99CH_3D1]